MSKIKYTNYTAGDVRAWLYEGAENGLSEQVISKVRANAILHNPDLKDDMVIVVTATDGDRVVGFTAMFPEHLVQPNVWLTVPTTLYAHPDYAGEFIGYYVSKVLHDTAGGRLVIGTDLAKETILIDKLLGLKADLFPRKRIILRRTIPWDSMRHVLSSFYELVRIWKQKHAIQRVIKNIPDNLRLEYTNFVDAEMYDFIVRQSGDAMFIRSQEMLNWILVYPFGVEASLYQYVGKQNRFTSQTPERDRKLYKVYMSDLLIGICMMDSINGNVNIRLLYVDKKFKEVNFSIIVRHVIQTKSHTLHSLYFDLNEYIARVGIALKIYEEPLVFTHPNELELSQSKQLQGADGDMFA